MVTYSRKEQRSFFRMGDLAKANYPDSFLGIQRLFEEPAQETHHNPIEYYGRSVFLQMKRIRDSALRKSGEVLDLSCLIEMIVRVGEADTRNIVLGHKISPDGFLNDYHFINLNGMHVVYPHNSTARISQNESIDRIADKLESAGLSMKYLGERTALFA